MVRGVGLAVDDYVRAAMREVLGQQNEIAGRRRPRPLLLVAHGDRGRVRLARMTRLPRVAVGGDAGCERRLQMPVQRIVGREIEIRGENARSGARYRSKR